MATKCENSSTSSEQRPTEDLTNTVRQLGVFPSSLTTHTIRILPGMEIYSTLQEYVRQNNLQSAFVITAVGSVTQARLRFAHVAGGGDQSNRIQLINKYLEIVSLVGTISVGSHLHISLSDSEGNVIGGHVMGDLTVFTTCEVVIGESNEVRMTRPFDQKTGFPELKMELGDGSKILHCM